MHARGEVALLSQRSFLSGTASVSLTRPSSCSTTYSVSLIVTLSALITHPPVPAAEAAHHLHQVHVYSFEENIATKRRSRQTEPRSCRHSELQSVKLVVLFQINTHSFV